MNKRRILVSLFERGFGHGVESCAINLEVTQGDVRIVVPSIEISQEDYERLARAYDGVGYTVKFLSSEESFDHEREEQ